MSFTTPAFHIFRQSVVGSEGLWTKMFDPPRLGPPTPEYIDLTQVGLDGNPSNPKYPRGLRANPVASVLTAANMYNFSDPYMIDRSLMNQEPRNTWDGGVNTGSGAQQLMWFMFHDGGLRGNTFPDFLDGRTLSPSDPVYPAPMTRAPRGAVCQFHTGCGGPPPHTIHWHGIEPTPMNDGVGHCSFEVSGSYIYQWQPNFIGTYFFHCHRNTMQHFNFGLHGMMPFETPDAYFASIAQITDKAKGTVLLNSTPIGNGRAEPGYPLGRRRTAANLNFTGLPAFPGFQAGDPVQGVATPDLWTGDPFLKFKYDPHAFTVPYDVEAIWVPTDRASQWGNPSAAVPGTAPFQTFPEFGSIPGVNDKFHANAGPTDFFSFNDYNADYWFISGVPVHAVRGSAAQIPAGIVLPTPWNAGIAGSQVSINAGVGQTVFVRNLNSSYASVRVTFPLDVVIIEWDGRALGVPPLNQYTRPYLVKAGTPIVSSTARRWGAIFRSTTAVVDFAKMEFLDTRSTSPLTLTGGGDVEVTAMIPINIL